jgi:putative OPT family oligopeptide transporter
MSKLQVTERSATGFRPYIAPETRLRELTPIPLIVGTLLGMVFGASSLYLVLKVGLTVSASIPVAVISISLFTLFSKFGLRNATILENNIVQTAGSAGESIAFGVGVTMPAILILGFDLEFTRVMLVATLGGLLGILIQQHGLLKYPEGTACAEVLKAGASDESRQASAEHAEAGEADKAEARGGGRIIFTGFGIGLFYTTVMKALYAWREYPTKVFGEPFKAGSVSVEASSALLGVGYIIGPRIGGIMAAGGVLAYLVLIPMIKFFGDGLTTVLAPEAGGKLISEMSPDDIRGAYVLYIGAGAVTAGGLISLFRSLPTIWHGLRGGIKDIRAGGSGSGSVLRTEQDLSMKVVLGGIVLLIAMIMLASSLHMNLLGAVLIIAFGFLFVTVSSRLTGEIGSTSNPISGMTVATLLLTCLIFLIQGWTGPSYYVTALSVGAIVCIAASNGGTTSQDLKTGFLVGGTPRNQQIAILVGSLASALILGPILLRLNDAATVYVPRTTFSEIKGPAIQPSSTSALAIWNETDLPTGSGGSFRHLVIEPGTQFAAAPQLGSGQYLIDELGTVVYRVERNFPADLRADVSQLSERESPAGPNSGGDTRSYYVWQRTETGGASAQKFLVDDSGIPVYLVDPGINGAHKKALQGNVVPAEGREVGKFDAPKATLMSYIIKGILNQELPWALVLLGAMISVVLEMASIPSLAFAVGVYLPLSSSSPIFLGGLIRWLVDRYIRKKMKDRKLSEEELTAEGDKSHGVLMASGYIAGGAIAGIIIAFMAGVLTGVNDKLSRWATENNPFFEGPYADVLSLIPFLILIVILYLTGREVIMSGKTRKKTDKA